MRSSIVHHANKNNIKLLYAAILVALAFLFPSTAKSTLASTTTPVQVAATTTATHTVLTTKEVVQEYFSDIPIMIKIASCESHYTQFNKDGSVHRGIINPKDVGAMQINEYWNGATAKALGYNIYTLKGNLAFGRWLYKTRGLQPWLASSACWGSGMGTSSVMK